MGEGLRLVSAGLLIGISIAALATRSMSALLFDIQPGDPLTFAGVAGTVMLMTAFACYLPACRADRPGHRAASRVSSGLLTSSCTPS